MTWKPIETAPTNKRVLVFIKEEDRDEHQDAELFAIKEDGVWWPWRMPGKSRAITPTHWMPIPPPPSKE